MIHHSAGPQRPWATLSPAQRTATIHGMRPHNRSTTKAPWGQMSSAGVKSFAAKKP